MLAVCQVRDCSHYYCKHSQQYFGVLCFGVLFSVGTLCAPGISGLYLWILPVLAVLGAGIGQVHPVLPVFWGSMLRILPVLWPL